MFTSVLLAVAIGVAPPAIHEGPAAQAAAARSTVTAAQVAPFVGDWTLALQGANGPGTFTLSVKMEGEKPHAEVSSDQLPKQTITEFSMPEKTLLMPYTFTWDGNPVNAVVKLTPSPDGTVKAQMDFADGAYVMDGTATKKDKR